MLSRFWPCHFSSPGAPRSSRSQLLLPDQRTCSALETGLLGALLSSNGMLRHHVLKLFFAAKEGRNCHFFQIKVRVQ